MDWCLESFLSEIFNASWLALGSDALINRQALFEQSELVCPPKVSVRPIKYGQNGRQWFWLLLPNQK